MSRKVTIIFFLCLGLVAGLGCYTFWYAQGFSYLSDRSEACKNCHVMNDVYNSWVKGGHQHVATCNGCHVPHDFLGKWFVKATNGLHHSYAFTFKDVPVVIKAREKSRQVVQNNCERCHSSMAASAISACAREQASKESLSCVSCHREVGHTH